jgi:hypothetical protein
MSFVQAENSRSGGAVAVGVSESSFDNLRSGGIDSMVIGNVVGGGCVTS